MTHVVQASFPVRNGPAVLLTEELNIALVIAFLQGDLLGNYGVSQGAWLHEVLLILGRFLGKGISSHD